MMDSGGLVPDEVIIGLVRRGIDQDQSEGKGFLLDGFPRTVAQAEALEKFLCELKIQDVRIVSLDAPEEELVTRLVKRGLDSADRTIRRNHPPQIGSLS